MRNMLKTALLSIALLVVSLSMPSMAHAQGSSYPGVQPTSQPNYLVGQPSFTATAQTSSNLTLGGYATGTILVKGTALTTVTFAIQGSNDGVNFFPLPTAAIGVPGTTALTQTATANALYIVNLAGLSSVRFVTSGTFTATSVTIRLVASSNKGAI